MTLESFDKWRRVYGYSMILGGVAGFLSSFVLLMDKINYLETGKYPNCSINAFIDCGKVFNSPYASYFGFPNVVIGLAMFPLGVLLGVMLLKNVKVPTSIYRAGIPLVWAAIIFCFVFLYTTSYLIGAVCLWCSLAWTGTFFIVYPYLQWYKFLQAKTPSREEKVVDYWDKNWMLAWFGIFSVFFIGNIVLSHWANSAGYWDYLPHFDPFFWLKK